MPVSSLAWDWQDVSNRKKIAGTVGMPWGLTHATIQGFESSRFFRRVKLRSAVDSPTVCGLLDVKQLHYLSDTLGGQRCEIRGTFAIHVGLMNARYDGWTGDGPGHGASR
jgi:hypothetical protein